MLPFLHARSGSCLRTRSVVLSASVLVLALAGCEERADDASFALGHGRELDDSTTLTRIALGSCNRTTLPQPIWDPVVAADPQLWIWLGDNVYGDTRDMNELRRKYAAQLAVPAYRRLLTRSAVIGTWDDHDYGENNAGRDYPMRSESQQAALDFLGVPVADPRRDRRGLYSSYTYGQGDRRVKVILLDARYHRADPGSGGTVLGEEQWAWLEAELRNSDARLHLIGDGIQFLPEDHGYEKWANFPDQRRRLLDLIGASGAPGVILLSGDRHFAEISRVEDPALHYPLWEITASGMTHSWDDAPGEVNRHRVGELYPELNFGFVEIDWQAGWISLQIRSTTGATARESVIGFGQLAVPPA